jgi:hypothetical protein
MKYEIAYVTHGHRWVVYQQCLPYLQKAEGFTLGRKTVDDLSSEFFNPQIGLWVVVEKESGDIHGYLMTRIDIYPQAKHLVCCNIGGKDGVFDVVVDLAFETIERFAKDAGCDGIEWQGRAAWRHYTKNRGYEQPYTQFYKKLGA